MDPTKTPTDAVTEAKKTDLEAGPGARVGPMEAKLAWLAIRRTVHTKAYAFPNALAILDSFFGTEGL